jgi:hypothetical protein
VVARERRGQSQCADTRANYQVDGQRFQHYETATRHSTARCEPNRVHPPTNLRWQLVDAMTLNHVEREVDGGSY